MSTVINEVALNEGHKNSKKHGAIELESYIQTEIHHLQLKGKIYWIIQFNLGVLYYLNSYFVYDLSTSLLFGKPFLTKFSN
jgi:hypothetical protein